MIIKPGLVKANLSKPQRANNQARTVKICQIISKHFEHIVFWCHYSRTIRLLNKSSVRFVLFLKSALCNKSQGTVMFKLAYLKTVETVENTKRKNIFKDLVNAFKQFYVCSEERL